MKSKLNGYKIKLSYNLLLYLSLFIIGFLPKSCSYFLGSGASSISKKVKTIKIKDFSNNASQADPNFAYQLRLELIRLFQSRAQLQNVNEDEKGDIEIEGSIVDYRAEFINPSSTENIAQNSNIIIKVSINYINYEETEKNFNNENFQNNPFTIKGGEDLNEGINRNMNELVRDIALKIYNKIANDW